mmetsp:Transcript_8655/g.20211  ORF Transcript_8655/g.20211 Transcript_8655/m.20211 type:complete len:222 (-) Transcript_8655:24-689(-)
MDGTMEWVERRRLDEDEESIRLAIESYVLVRGLQSAAGQKLNGRLGKLLKKRPNDDGRFPVEIDDPSFRGAGKLLKEVNLQRLTREDLCQTYLLPDHKIQFWPRMHSMFTLCDVRGNSPVLAICDFPVMVSRLHDGSNMDNQWATWMMIDPITGFAPYDWQCRVGRTLVYRPGGLDLDRADMSAINMYFSAILDRYSEPGFEPSDWVNPTRFRRFIAAQKI